MSLDASSETEKPQDTPLTREDIPELVKAVAEALKDRSTPSQGMSRDADDGSSSKTGTSAATGELAKHHNRPCHARCQIYVGSALLNVFYIRERAKLALIQRALHGAYCCCAAPYPAAYCYISSMVYCSLFCATFNCARPLCSCTTLPQH